MGLFSTLVNLFSSPERQALNVLKRQRKIIAQAGGSSKLINNYLQENYTNDGGVTSALNCAGLDFEKDPGKNILSFAALDLLYEARFKHHQEEVIRSLLEYGKEAVSAEDVGKKLVEVAVGKGYQQNDLYKIAQPMNYIFARMVSYDDAVAGQDEPWAAEFQIEEGELLFDVAKSEASAELMRSLLDNANDMSKGDRVAIFARDLRSLDSENIRYWQRTATEREKKAKESFEKWENTKLDLLKKLVKG